MMFRCFFSIVLGIMLATPQTGCASEMRYSLGLGDETILPSGGKGTPGTVGSVPYGKNTVEYRQGGIRQAAIKEERRVAEEKAAEAREQQRKNALFTVALSSDGMDPTRSRRDWEEVFVFSGDVLSQNITIQSTIKSAPNALLAYPARITVRYRLRYPVTTSAFAMMSLTEMKNEDIVRTYSLVSHDGVISDTVHFTLVAAARVYMGIKLGNIFLSGDPELVVDVLEVKEP